MHDLQTTIIAISVLLASIILLTVVNVYVFIRNSRLDAKMKAHNEFLVLKMEELEKLKEKLDLKDKVNEGFKSEIISPTLNTIYRFWPSDN